MNDLDHLLPGIQGSGYFITYRALPNALDKILDDCIVNIRLQQRQADLTHGGVHILFRKLAAPAKLMKNIIQPLGQVLKHSTAF